ncbi:MAG TPA: NAD-dependent epimerase/dehydratase family protein [Deltaproteobacteria bacterium]|nr:NAD-dependent epimerase/dehydratase family protein [Deltaproteobacteria bacterium]
MRSLVTGATGFIGGVLARGLQGRGHAVRVLAFSGEDTAPLEELGMEVRRGDLTDRRSLRGLADGVDTVYHVAGRVIDWGTRQQFYGAIYDATHNLVQESLGKASRFVYISSIAALGFGRHLKGLKESDPAVKCGIPYCDAKLDTEQLVMAAHLSGTIDASIIRPSNVIGPGSVWVREIVDKMLSMPVPLIDGGRYSASLISVNNLVDGIMLAGTLDIAKGKVYHLRDDWDITWKQYLSDLGNLVGKRPAFSVPYPVARAAAWACDMVCTPLGIRPPGSRLSIDVTGRDMDVDNTLAKRELGWRTKVSYTEAMDDIAAWVREHYRTRT